MPRRIDCCVTGGCRNSLLLSLAAGLALLAPVSARADTSTPRYKSEQVIQAGVTVDGVLIPASYHLYVGGLGDTGQILFSAGGPNQDRPERLFQYAGGKFTAIVTPSLGPEAGWPGDVYWPADVTIARPLSMNGSGNAVFAAGHVFGTSPWGTFMWNAAVGHTVAVALKDMPATRELRFVSPGGYAPAINSSNEIALIGLVKNAAGTPGWALFRLGRDGVMKPVARPHEELPDGVRISIDEFPLPSIDDSGRVAFLAHPDGSGRQNAYLWAHDAVSPILTVGAAAPDGSKITAISGVFLNSQNSSALVMAATAGSSRYGLFRVQNDKTAAVALPGQPMPGGGKLQTVQYVPVSDFDIVPSVAVSAASARGEHVFLATLEDGTLAAYKIDQNGGLSLVLKGDFDAEPIHIAAALPPLTFVPGSRPGINSRGQIALSVQRAGSRATIVLMTPEGS